LLFFLDNFLLIFIVHPEVVVHLSDRHARRRLLLRLVRDDVETALIQLNRLVGQILQGWATILKNAFGEEPDLATFATLAAHFELELSSICSLDRVATIRNVTIVNDTVDFVKLARPITQSHIACHEALGKNTAFVRGLMVEELGLLIELRRTIFLLYHGRIAVFIFCHLLCQCNELIIIVGQVLL
jgi:hypothetical protein